MNKTIIIIVVIFALILTGGVIFLLVISKRPTNTPQLENTYTVSITEQNKNLTQTLTQSGKTTNLNDQTIGQYALVTYNSPKDVMWVQCYSGYTQTGANSSTNNPIAKDPVTGSAIELISGKTNNLTITCSK